MRNYVEPNFEIVTIKTADVITLSLGALFTNVGTSGIEDGGRQDISTYEAKSL